MSSFVDTSWLADLAPECMGTVMLEYRFLVRRFPQWLLLTAGRCEDEYVRQLLLPNIVEECGLVGEVPSHLELLDRCCYSLGLSGPSFYRPSIETRDLEAWFYEIFLRRDVYRCLCVLGPGTEAISEYFLLPLERGIKRLYPEESIDLRYFAAHKAEVEGEHAEDIERALAYLEGKASQNELASLGRIRERWARAGLMAHSRFWANVKSILGPG